jgi:hypothetical protein
MNGLLKKTGESIAKNLEKALFKVKHDMSVDSIKEAKSLLSEANYQIQQYEAQLGHHNDASRSAKALSGQLALKIANHTSERNNYA